MAGEEELGQCMPTVFLGQFVSKLNPAGLQKVVRAYTTCPASSVGLFITNILEYIPGTY
jgi:hypothetical protein